MSKLNKMIKYTIVILLLFTYMGNLFAQDKEEKYPKLNVKLNASTLIGVVNPAVEFRVFNKGSVQLEGCLCSTKFLRNRIPLLISPYVWRVQILS